MRLIWQVISVLLGISCCIPLWAQERCAIVEYTQNLQKNKGLTESTPQFEQWIGKNISQRQAKRGLRDQETTYRIPVVVHVIHNGQAIGVGSNISDERITSQIAVLNEDFNRLNADAVNTPAEFLPVAGNIAIEFVLARQDPDGNPTDGIVRVDGNRSSWSATSDDEELKALSYWNSTDYLNIWVANLSGSYLGYAQFPVSDLAGLEDYTEEVAKTDGVVIDYTAFGINAPNSSFNLGRTATHEVGHYLGLRHIWGDDANCSSTNDYVTDTPNQSDDTSGCPTHPQVDCSATHKMFQNYMDYTNDACMNLFTKGQVERMLTVLENSPRRNTLSSSYGLEDPVPGDIDVNLVSIDNPVAVVCDRSPEIKFTLENPSTTPVSSLRIKIIVNSVSKDINLTGLSFTGSATLTIPFNELETEENQGNLSYGENLISISILTINGKTDPVTQNNKLDANITVLYPDCDVFALYVSDPQGFVITFELSESSPVEISVINTMGQEVARTRYENIINQTVPLNLPAQWKGFYIVRLRVGSRFYTRKVYLHQ